MFRDETVRFRTRGNKISDPTLHPKMAMYGSGEDFLRSNPPLYFNPGSCFRKNYPGFVGFVCREIVCELI